MPSLMRWIRALCLACLALLAAAAAALYGPFWFGFCAEGAGGVVYCEGRAFRLAYEIGLTVIDLSVQLFVPAVLAAMGVFILVYEALRPAPPAPRR